MAWLKYNTSSHLGGTQPQLQLEARRQAAGPHWSTWLRLKHNTSSLRVSPLKSDGTAKTSTRARRMPLGRPGPRGSACFASKHQARGGRTIQPACSNRIQLGHGIQPLGRPGPQGRAEAHRSISSVAGALPSCLSWASSCAEERPPHVSNKARHALTARAVSDGGGCRGPLQRRITYQ